MHSPKAIRPLSIEVPTLPKAMLACTKCGAQAEAACDCGQPYIPAGQRAEAVLAASPELSDRSLAAAAGVSDFTIRHVRRRLGAQPLRRVGKDGRLRSAFLHVSTYPVGRVSNINNIAFQNPTVTIQCPHAD